MSDRTQQRDVQRIVFFGMRCSFSAPPLSALIDAGYDVVAIVLPGARFGPPILRQQATSAFPIFSTESSLWDIDALANKSGSPVLTIGDLNHPHAIGALADLKPDLIVTACFPDLLPPEVLNIPRQGALNVHPSLLPRWRGPEPLFWTFRHGDHESGVAIHLMDNGFDTGPILVQDAVIVPDGIRLPDFERELAVLGGKLVVQAVNELAAKQIAPTPQDDSRATVAPLPRGADFVVPTDHSARWAFNFVRAIAPTSTDLAVRIAASNELFRIIDAVELNVGYSIEHPYELVNDFLTVRFQAGAVTFRLGPN